MGDNRLCLVKTKKYSSRKRLSIIVSIVVDSPSKLKTNKISIKE